MGVSPYSACLDAIGGELPTISLSFVELFTLRAGELQDGADVAGIRGAQSREVTAPEFSRMDDAHTAPGECRPEGGALAGELALIWSPSLEQTSILN
jgi:hypothetical protein